jgi:pSer/pThr/pTyr-binding forkhead associated (FHA) protein
MIKTTRQRVYRLQTLLAELKRRSVFKVATVYAVTAWGASMGAAELMPAFGAPDWSVRIFVLCAILGMPVAVALAWAFEITPAGIVRDEANDTTEAPPGVIGQTTILSGSQGSIRVSWRDGSGSHEKIFHRDFRIGRDAACELHLDDPLISRRHAEVLHSEGLWWITDLGSRNGTLLNEHPVKRAPLPPQSEVKLYDTGPVLQLEVRAPSTAPTVSRSQFNVRT